MRQKAEIVSIFNFPDYPQTHLQIIQTLFRLYRYIFQIIRTLQIVQKLSSSSGHFAYYLDILYCKVSGNSSANNELVAKTYQIKRRNYVNFQLSRLSRRISRSYKLFLDYTDTFSRLSGHFLHRLKTFQFSSRNFLDHPDTFQFIQLLCIVSGYYLTALLL